MGAIHCPFGSAFYDDEPCIDCGLCLATNKEEMVAASAKIRKYLRARAEKTVLSKKIAIAGKGGVGKSTVVALLANAMSGAGHRVQVLDSDESNPGLQRLLGFDSRQAKPLMDLLERFSPDVTKSETKWLNREEIYSKDIPGEYVLERDSLKFLMVGKIEDPFQGCACSMADVARMFIQKLSLEDKEVVLIDMEAGVESFGRGMERGVDTVLIIVEPSFESLALAEKVSYMAEGIGVNRIRAILNKIPSASIEKKIKEELEKRKIKTAGTIYLDSKISEAGLVGDAIPDNSEAEKAARKIIQQLLAE